MAAARELAIVLRHQDRHGEAQRLMAAAAADVEATGLRTDAAAAAYAQMLCTPAYTAARAGQRTEALAMVEEARRSARRLPEALPPGRLFPFSPAAVDPYADGVHWDLGDAGAALEAGKDLRPAQFPTAERALGGRHARGAPRHATGCGKSGQGVWAPAGVGSRESRSWPKVIFSSS
ncbi:hypothetical protein GCM10010246_02720 [Streptomyces cuspidosporus]|uniref:Uncharacterized protein n=1 Tax=Streptomyces cuspidosporus TaxID=66882 RepID=A0ABN3F9W5_9ACTN